MSRYTFMISTISSRSQYMLLRALVKYQALPLLTQEGCVFDMDGGYIDHEGHYLGIRESFAGAPHITLPTSNQLPT